MTQDGRQYQVVVLISVPSIFVILLEGGIRADPNEVREGIVGDWRQSPHTRRWKSHGYYGGSIVPAGRFSSGHISSPNAPCPRVFSFLVTGDMYNCYCPGKLNSFQEPADLGQILDFFSLRCSKSPFLVYQTLNMDSAKSISAVHKNGESLPFCLFQSLY